MCHLGNYVKRKSSKPGQGLSNGILECTENNYRKSPRYLKFSSDPNREELTKRLKVMANIYEGNHSILKTMSFPQKRCQQIG